ncbi:hypothetical protein [Ureibacillus acetophenoni]|uniref:Uncharacterized protein n=1 Tax=Ureibacillus acetophenoni TaxID=614649 RepID=A0A285UI26_9BACL|nr:hypothetical protein [Ureibacillus acetophenoni]SOC41462.1 hypothetical protein SAMN05877842_11073 [Ureibacillus acetophenoni]
MDEVSFKEFLENSSNISSKEKAVRSRISKALKVERDLNVNLDSIVCDDNKTYELLTLIPKRMNEQNGVYQNAVRKYYEFRNHKKFPKLNDFKRY